MYTSKERVSTLCPAFARCLAMVSSLSIPESYINNSLRYCCCKTCRAEQKGEAPKGCCYFGLQVDQRKDHKAIFSAWRKAYHGTSQEFVRSIAINGILFPGDKVTTSTPIKEKPSHRQNQKYIYSSTNYKYCLNNSYAKPYELDGFHYQFVFEMRFEPGNHKESGDVLYTDIRGSYVHVALLLFEDNRSSYNPIGRRAFTGHSLGSKSQLEYDVCGICQKESKGLIVLSCGHRFHALCVIQYILIITEGRVLLTLEEKKKLSIECVVCFEKVEEEFIKKLFVINVKYYEEQRNARATSGKKVELMEDVKQPPLVVDKPEKIKDEVRIPSGGNYVLSCCQTIHKIADIKVTLNKGILFEHSPIESNLPHII